MEREKEDGGEEDTQKFREKSQGEKGSRPWKIERGEWRRKRVSSLATIGGRMSGKQQQQQQL